MVYGEEFFDRGQITSLRKLQDFQNRALSLICNTRKSLPIAARHMLCQIPPLEIRRNQNILNLQNRLKYNQENPANRIYEDNYSNVVHYNNRNKIKTTLCEKTKELIDNHNLQVYRVNKMPKPQEYWAIKHINVEQSLTEIIEKGQPKSFKLNTVMNHIHTKYPNHNHVYTDGAKNKHTGRTGIGFFDSTHNRHYKAQLDRHLHIDTVEVAAASYASKFITSYYPNTNSLIISDSLSTCRNLRKYNDSYSRIDLVEVIQKHSHNIHINKGTLTILWVPGHINLYGHDIADLLAKEGTECNQIHSINHSVQELKNIIQSEYTNSALQTYWNESSCGSFGRTIIPNFNTKINIDNFSNANSDSHLLIRLIFGTAEFHIPRNRICANCQRHLSIEHVLLHCSLFNRTRENLKINLQRINKEFNLRNILDPNCHTSARENRKKLIR